MNLMLHLTPELETKLGEQAKALGKTPEAIALQVLEERLEDQPLANASLSTEDWVKSFETWVASHQPIAHFVDDSRESIYAGRGE